MPKYIELTVEIEIQRVSCPGVWLCQDGKVSLSVYALGTSYQTCLLPPTFPLMFKDVFYFRKRFNEFCALNNLCCLLKDETIYCELVQWSDDCLAGECTVLAQYLGAMNDVLFPSNLCSNDGVDLLMRRTDNFPGILSPKIEIATKVRIDEIWNQPCSLPGRITSCFCSRGQGETSRQRQVCHSPQYHRRKCSSNISREHQSSSCTRSRSRSTGSRSCCSLVPNCSSTYRRPRSKSRHSRCSTPKTSPRRTNYVYNVKIDDPWIKTNPDLDETSRIENLYEDKLEKIILESRYIDDDKSDKSKEKKTPFKSDIRPCVCEICRRYYELFHGEKDKYY